LKNLIHLGTMGLVCISIVCFTQLSIASSVDGAVYDYYGTTPIAGVQVKFMDYYGDGSELYQTFTATDGTFNVGLPEGTYLGAVNTNQSTTSYLSQYYGGVNYIYWATPIIVEVDTTVSEIYFYLYAGFRVSGTVTDQSGTGESTDLYAYDNTTGYYFGNMLGFKSNADTGAFSCVLPQGVFSLTAYPESNLGAGEQFPLLVNDDVDGVAIRLPVTAAVSGHVQLHNGTPVDSIRIDALDTLSGYSENYAYTDDSGDYRIEGLRSGRSYRILARTVFHDEELYSEYPGTFYPNKTSPADAQIITMTAGDKTGIDIVLPNSSGTIIGRVTDSEGSPLIGAYVYDFYCPDPLNPYVAISQRSALTDETGGYMLSGIGPARVGVAVSVTGYIPQIWDHEEMTTLLDTATCIDVSAGETVTNVDFLLHFSDSLENTPSVSSISPHLIFRGATSTLTIEGENFDSGSNIDLVDSYSVHYEGNPPVLQSFSIVSPEMIEVTVVTNQTTAVGPYFVAITKPDSQYVLTGFDVITPTDFPGISLIAAPEDFIPASTWSLGWNMTNLTETDRTMDIYMGLLLPTSDFIFTNGTEFTFDVIKFSENMFAESGYFLPQTFLFEIPLSGAVLPPGTYTWIIASFEPGTFELIDLSMKNQTTD
jgi:hypothetical protein